MEGVWLSTYTCLNCTSVNIMQSIWYWPNSVEGAYHCLVFQLILVWCLHAILSFQQRYDKCTLKCNYELCWWTIGSIIAMISAFKACHIQCSFCTCYLFSFSCFCFLNIGTKPVLQGLKSCTTARSAWNFSFSVVFDSVFCMNIFICYYFVVSHLCWNVRRFVHFGNDAFSTHVEVSRSSRLIN